MNRCQLNQCLADKQMLALNNRTLAFVIKRRNINTLLEGILDKRAVAASMYTLLTLSTIFMIFR
jgi:hypothetical protein